jgi:acyl transferase domain-containing protein
MNHANSSSSFLWQTDINLRFLTYLKDHKIDDDIIFPAAAYVEMAMQACREAGVGVEYEIGEFLLARKMLLQEGITRQVKTLLSFEKGAGGKISINSRQSPEDKWELHGYARILKAEPALEPYRNTFSEDAAFSNATSFYKGMDRRGLNYGPAFRGVEGVWDNENEALGKIRLPDILRDETGDYLVHPALLDACLQSSGAIKNATTLDELYIPLGFKRIRFFAKPGCEVWCHSQLHRTGEEGKLLVDIRITDDKRQPVVELKGFQMHRIRHSKNS